MTEAAGVKTADPESIESIRTLYRQVPNSFIAALVVTVYMVATAWPYSDHTAIGVWLAIQVATQGLRGLIYFGYRRRQPASEHLPRWALAYTVYMLVAGLVWGLSALLFIRADEPITLALTLCGLYGIAAGSVPGNAYNPPGCYAFVVTIFALVTVKMLLIGGIDHIVLGIASVLFAVIMVLFCRVQHRALRDGFAIRFENRKIMAEMEIARRRAEQASLAKSQFLAAASHDLRQPLYALSLFSSSLQRFALDKDAHDVVGHIQTNISALESLFNGLLDLSRLDAGAVSRVNRAFRLQDIFDRLERMFEPLAGEKGLRLHVRTTGVWLMSDEILAEQIVMNLLSNALRYTSDGWVLLAARRRGGKIVIEVRDSGPGIAAADQDRIFDEFFQIGNTARDKTKGLGLGLAIAARTAALLDSRIDLWSEAGHGSVFSLALLEAEAQVQAARQEGPVTADSSLSSLRLLVVDDDPAVRKSLEIVLDGWGVAHRIAATLAQAEAALSEGVFDMVLCDYRLQEGYLGLEFLESLKGRERSPFLCLVTGDVDPDLMARALAVQIPLLHKPVHPARLRALLAHVASEG